MILFFKLLKMKFHWSHLEFESSVLMTKVDALHNLYCVHTSTSSRARFLDWAGIPGQHQFTLLCYNHAAAC